MARTYTLQKRAERMAETRRRIVESAVALHTTLGPAGTSLSAIAEHAGVQRHTLYAHFPDTDSLFRACSARWEECHPMPDFEGSLGRSEPAGRLRGVLEQLYAWYDEVEDDLALFERDAHVFPEWGDAAASALGAIRDELAGDRPPLVRAAVGHALQFGTWRSLVRREGLEPRAAVDLMVTLAFA